MINGLNLYAYCLNDPINFLDSNGWFRISAHERRRTVGFESVPLFGFPYIAWLAIYAEREEADGGDGFFYSYSSTKRDMGSLLGLFGVEIPSVGVGLNFWNTVKIEAGVKVLGVEAAVQIWRFNISANVNLLGGTSISIGYAKPNPDGTTTTIGINLGINTILGIGLLLSGLPLGAPTTAPAPVPAPLPTKILSGVAKTLTIGIKSLKSLLGIK